MGQKIHPIGFRIGITKNHNSIWFSNSKNYSLYLKEDFFIRTFIEKKINDTCISNIEILRKLNFIIINIYVLNPNVVIGDEGAKLFLLRKLLKNSLDSFFGRKEIIINVLETSNPNSNSKIVSDFIKQQLESRVQFRRAIKSAITKAQEAKVKGIKIQLSGRLNGAEIARSEWVREGQVPLHTLKADIDYFQNKAQTIYGILGIKVWIYKE